MIESVEEFGNRWRDRALEAELEVERLKAQLATQTAATEGHAGQAALRERYAIAIHDAMEPDLSLADQEPAYQALIARAAEAAMALADTGRAAVLREASETHACASCEGDDPDTCFNNPHRPPEQCPRSEFDGYGLQCQKPAGHNLCTFEEQPSVQSCGDAKLHPSHTFLRMDVLFQCPGVEGKA